ncbi:DUF998 domain-containing protein [Micromonospora sp. RTGN7]|uniref:DUF998 domain-containing protein n=1 Tax=Micromonospora sp. RTGN7 TaxID=3016526 RepID=UPI0029FECFDE|nr:DUF998 domain-containing protein [Micromonospora sp. RTGN7]
MRVVPRWALLCAGAAPVFLVGGWTLGTARQPGGFDQVAETISALAAVGAADRWIMTLGLVGLGLCHCATAAALRPLAPGGRALLALGGVGILAVAALPRPVDGSSTPHTLAAVVAFAALAVWPALAPTGVGWRPSPPGPRPLGSPAEAQPAAPNDGSPGSPAEAGPAGPGDGSPVAAGADRRGRARATTGGYVGGRAGWVALSVGLLVPVLWFAVEFVTDGGRVGLSERVAAGVEALCPLLVVGWLRGDRRSSLLGGE